MGGFPPILKGGKNSRDLICGSPPPARASGQVRWPCRPLDPTNVSNIVFEVGAFHARWRVISIPAAAASGKTSSFSTRTVAVITR